MSSNCESKACCFTVPDLSHIFTLAVWKAPVRNVFQLQLSDSLAIVWKLIMCLNFVFWLSASTEDRWTICSCLL